MRLFTLFVSFVFVTVFFGFYNKTPTMQVTKDWASVLAEREWRVARAESRLNRLVLYTDDARVLEFNYTVPNQDIDKAMALQPNTVVKLTRNSLVCKDYNVTTCLYPEVNEALVRQFADASNSDLKFRKFGPCR